MKPKNKKDLLALCLLAINVLMLLMYITSLPDTIPIHFDLAGKPDGYGSKHILWFLTALAGGVWWMFVSLKDVDPQKNKKGSSLSKNEHVYILETMNIGIQLIFLYITFQTIRVALQYTDSLNIVVMLLLIVILLFPLIRVYWKRKRS